MADEPDQRQTPEEPGEWLPPEPPGGASPQPPPPRPAAYQPPQPPPGYPPGQQPPPVYPPPGYAAGGFPPPAYPPVYQPLPPQPPNNDAVVGFTCAVIGAALLFFTAGLSTIISLILGIVAIPYCRKGKKKIAAGETRKHKDLANSGYVVAIVTVVLAVLATVTWALLLALVDWDEVERDLEEDGGEEIQIYLRAAVRAGAGAVRLLG
jgi:hypothetical protein